MYLESLETPYPTMNPLTKSYSNQKINFINRPIALKIWMIRGK